MAYGQHPSSQYPAQREARPFVTVAKVKDVKTGQIKGLRLRGGVEIAVANVDGQFFAFEAYCPHNRWPLKWGAIDRGALLCALHMWRFDLETGEMLDPPMADCLQTYPCRVEGDLIQVAL